MIFHSFTTLYSKGKNFEKIFWGRKFDFKEKRLEIWIQNSGDTKGFQYLIFFAFKIYFVDAVRVVFLIFFLVLHIWLG